MDALDYCNDKVALPGTPGYYAVLFHPAAVRAALVALRALERELSDVVELCTDRDVAQHKLHYWQQELLGNSASQPHPVTRALQQYTGDILDKSARGQLIEGIAQRISLAQVNDEAQIEQMSALTAGTIAQACAQLANEQSTGAVEVAIATERLRLLRMPRRAGLPAHSGIALSTLTACAVTPRQVDRADADPALVRLRAALLEQVCVATRRADKLLAKRRGYLATCLRLTRCLLTANQSNHYARTGELARVTPLRLLWHAWLAKN